MPLDAPVTMTILPLKRFTRAPRRRCIVSTRLAEPATSEAECLVAPGIPERVDREAAVRERRAGRNQVAATSGAASASIRRRHCSPSSVRLPLRHAFATVCPGRQSDPLLHASRAGLDQCWQRAPAARTCTSASSTLVAYRLRRPFCPCLHLVSVSCSSRTSGRDVTNSAFNLPPRLRFVRKGQRMPMAAPPESAFFTIARIRLLTSSGSGSTSCSARIRLASRRAVS